MASEILRPEAAGSETSISAQYPTSGEHWDKVCDSSDGTYVRTKSFTYQRDLFNLPVHSAGTYVKSVTIYFRIRAEYDNAVSARPSQKSGITVTDGTVAQAYSTWETFYQTYTLNPATGNAYTAAEIDALEIGLQLLSSDPNKEVDDSEVYAYIVYYTVPTVTTQAADSVEATACTGNGNITDSGEGCARRGFCYKAGTSGDPTIGDSVVYDDDAFGNGAYTKAITGLSTGTSYRVRAYVVNPAGTSYGDTVQILTKPAAPTNIVATKGDYPDKVVITWTKSDGATGYRPYRDGILLTTLGDVGTYDDVNPSPPVITPGIAVATDGKHASYVRLSLSGTSIVVGTSHTYKVVAVNATGDSVDSATDTGYCGYGEFTYQWQRSVADSDAAYSNITGATFIPYFDTGAPAYPNGGRYYRCILNATGAGQKITTVDRGYRRNPLKAGNIPTVVIKNSDGETLAYTPLATGIGPDYRINELGSLTFSLPGSDPARAYLVYPNEAWLYVDGVLKNIFKILRAEKAR